MIIYLVITESSHYYFCNATHKLTYYMINNGAFTFGFEWSTFTTAPSDGFCFESNCFNSYTVSSRNILTPFWEVDWGAFTLVELGLDCQKRFGDVLHRFGGYDRGIMFATYFLCHPNEFMGTSWNKNLAHDSIIFPTTFSFELYIDCSD